MEGTGSSAGHTVHQSVHGEAAFSASVPARPARNGVRFGNGYYIGVRRRSAHSRRVGVNNAVGCYVISSADCHFLACESYKRVKVGELTKLRAVCRAGPKHGKQRWIAKNLQSFTRLDRTLKGYFSRFRRGARDRRQEDCC